MLDLHSLSATDLERLYSSTKLVLVRLKDADQDLAGGILNHFNELLRGIETEIVERAVLVDSDKLNNS